MRVILQLQAILIIISFKLDSIYCFCNTINDELICKEFDSFNKINFTEFKSQTFGSITLYPKKRLQLNSELSLENLNIKSNEFNLDLNNISGFDMNNPFALREIHNSSLSLSDSIFDFYFENVTIDSKKCQDLNDNYLFISTFDVFNTIVLNKDIEYSSETCPIHFKNQYINSFKINYLNSSNMPYFLNINSLNCTINSLEMNQIENFTLDDKFLQVDIFNKLNEIKILNSSLTSIQDNLFQNLKNLKYLELELNNFQQFLSNGLDWINSLNENLTVNLSDPSDNNRQYEIYIKLTDLKSEFNYSEESFCLFKKFPRGRQVYPIINTIADLECTCTLLFLLENRGNISLQETDSTRNCLNDQNIDNLINDCKFEEKILYCDNPTSPTTTISTTTTTTTTLFTNETSTEKAIETNNDALLIALIAVSSLFLLSIVIAAFIFLKKRIFSKSSSNKKSNNTELKSYKL